MFGFWLIGSGLGWLVVLYSHLTCWSVCFYISARLSANHTKYPSISQLTDLWYAWNVSWRHRICICLGEALALMPPFWWLHCALVKHSSILKSLKFTRRPESSFFVLCPRYVVQNTSIQIRADVHSADTNMLRARKIYPSEIFGTQQGKRKRDCKQMRFHF